jgi:hypothetical protein
MFPPGRSSRRTMPPATGSLTFAKMIGIVRVSRWMATVAAVPFVTMMSGCEYSPYILSRMVPHCSLTLRSV